MSKILKSGCKVEFNGHGCTITNPTGQKVAEAYLANDVYKLVTQTRAVACLATSDQDSYVWHQRLGHLSLLLIKRLPECTLEVKVFPKTPEKIICISCLEGENIRPSFKEMGTKATQILELIHSDLCGPMENKSLGNSRYLITFIDNFSRKVFVYFMEDKTDVLSKFKKFKALVENLLNKTIKAIRTDHGKEYINHVFKTYLIQEASSIKQPEQNGLAERMNRTLIERAKCMLFNANLPKFLWAEAISTAAYLTNRLPKKSLSHITLDSKIQYKPPKNFWLRGHGSYS